MQVPKKLGMWKYRVPELEFECRYEIEKGESIKVSCSLPRRTNMDFLYNDPTLQKRIKENTIRSHPGIVRNFTEEYYKRLEEFGEDPIEFDPVEREKYFISAINGFVYTSRYFPSKSNPHEIDSVKFIEKLMEEAEYIIEEMMGIPRMFKTKEIYGEQHFNGYINFLERIDDP